MTEEIKVKAPWKDQLGDIPFHLDYFEGSMYEAVKNFAGHIDEETTLKYYTFDREAKAVRNEQIEKALSFNPAK